MIIPAAGFISLPCAHIGNSSPPEKEILAELLRRRAKIILCPAWKLESVHPEFIEPLQENRMLILEMKDRSGDLAVAEQRNRFVIHVLTTR